MTTQKLGYDLAKGAAKYAAMVLIAAFAVSLLFSFIRSLFGWGVDDSDRSKWERSGLRILTDAKTGVQYVSDSNGGLTVRVDRDGKPLREGGAK